MKKAESSKNVCHGKRADEETCQMSPEAEGQANIHLTIKEVRTLCAAEGRYFGRPSLRILQYFRASFSSSRIFSDLYPILPTLSQ